MKQNKSAYPYMNNHSLPKNNDHMSLISPGPVTAGPDIGRSSSRFDAYNDVCYNTQCSSVILLTMSSSDTISSSRCRPRRRANRPLQTHNRQAPSVIPSMEQRISPCRRNSPCPQDTRLLSDRTRSLRETPPPTPAMAVLLTGLPLRRSPIHVRRVRAAATGAAVFLAASLSPQTRAPPGRVISVSARTGSITTARGSGRKLVSIVVHYKFISRNRMQ